MAKKAVDAYQELLLELLDREKQLLAEKEEYLTKNGGLRVYLEKVDSIMEKEGLVFNEAVRHHKKGNPKTDWIHNELISSFLFGQTVEDCVRDLDGLAIRG